MLWLRECPRWWGDQGQVRPLLTVADNVVLTCDECGTVWRQPDDVVEDGPFEEPSAPNWLLRDGDRLPTGEGHWATINDIKRVGWDKLDWHDNLIDP